jgi:hypothetical protein
MKSYDKFAMMSGLNGNLMNATDNVFLLLYCAERRELSHFRRA